MTTRKVYCVKKQCEADGMTFKPYPGELGERIYNEISQAAWDEWLNQQTMIINENRLQVTDPKSRDMLMQEAEKYFFGDSVA